MPATHYLVDGTRYEFGDELALEEAGICEAEAALASKPQAGRSSGLRVSPSMASPDTTCRREKVIEACLDYGIDPRKHWAATEGTAIHKALMENPLPYHFYELSVPGGLHLYDRDMGAMALRVWSRDGQLSMERPGVSLRRNEEDRVYEVEIFPGIFMHTTIDRVSPDFREIANYKTTKYPKVYGGKPGSAPKPPTEFWKDGNGNLLPPRDYLIQVNLERKILETCTGVPVVSMKVPRRYIGAHEPNWAFKLFNVPKIPDDALEAACREHYESLTFLLSEGQRYRAESDERLQAFLATLPMDGYVKGMYNNTKCFKYCSHQAACFALAGLSLNSL